MSSPDSAPRSSTRTGLIIVALVILGMGYCAYLIPSAPPREPAVTTDVRTPEPAAAEARPATTAEPERTTDISRTCGQVDGKTPADLKNLLTFCAKGIAAGAVTSASAMESLLWLKVTEDFARAIRADTLRGEQLVQTWMKGWRQESGRQSVSVTVEWQDVTVATGETTLMSGDQVTIR